MAFVDDDRPKKKPVHELGQDISQLSVGELDERIDALRAEIGRLEAAIGARKATRLGRRFGVQTVTATPSMSRVRRPAGARS